MTAKKTAKSTPDTAELTGDAIDKASEKKAAKTRVAKAEATEGAPAEPKKRGRKPKAAADTTTTTTKKDAKK